MNFRRLAYIIMTFSFVLIISGGVSSFLIGLREDREEINRRQVNVNDIFEVFSTNTSVFEAERDQLYNDVLKQLYYDTMYREKNVFGVKKAIIVTQKYHIYRSIFIAKKMGIDAYGVPTLTKRKWGIYREVREVLARTKDLIKTNITSSNNYHGETISLNQSGDVTNDK